MSDSYVYMNHYKSLSSDPLPTRTGNASVRVWEWECVCGKVYSHTRTLTFKDANAFTLILIHACKHLKIYHAHCRACG